ncbi:hypothetical protein [Legionella sp. W05-934-2]|uniref:hypothetical protein n=1 Tax=Legionella TaxID=445 RepID=UPI003463185B
MSKDKSNKPDDNEDPRKKSISNNPCGICRALGMPVCKGHGGGSGGGDNSDSKDKNMTDSQEQSSMLLSSLIPKPKNSTLFDLLSRSPLWSQIDEFIFQYKNPFALLSMTINMENNTLSLKGRDDLTQEEQQALDALFNSIEHELSVFKQENANTRPIQASMSRTGNEMTLNIPDPKQFDAFIQRLADKNLLVMSDKKLLLAQPGSEQKATKDTIESPQDSSWKAPTPFDSKF